MVGLRKLAIGVALAALAVGAFAAGDTLAAAPTISLDACNATGSQRVVVTDTGMLPLTGPTIFGTNLPESTVSTATSCSSGLGEARIYTVGFKDATSKIDQPVDGVLGANDRYSTVPGGGLPPPPVAISVEINGKFYEGVGMGPTIITPPGPSIAGRKRVYWNMLSESR